MDDNTSTLHVQYGVTISTHRDFSDGEMLLRDTNSIML